MKIRVAKEEVDFWIGCCERRLNQIDEYRANIDRQNEAKYAEFYNRLGWWRKKFHSPTLLPGSGWNSVIRDFYPSINGWGGYDHVKSLQRKLECRGILLG
jgi:hypothetical protein